MAAARIGLAQPGVRGSAHDSVILPRAQRRTSRGSGAAPLRGSASALLSYTTSSVSRGSRRIRFSRLVSKRSRTRASGISCPPRATLARTRAMCSSGVSRPTYQTRTSMPDDRARSSSPVIVLPPRVVSKAKSQRSAIARSRRRLPCCQAAAFASSWLVPGLADWISRAASSGLKYSAPACRNIAPAMLLLPAPLVPAST